MRTHTNNFKTNIKNLGRQYNVRVAYGNTTLQNEQINSATLNYNGDILKSVMKTLELDSNIDIPLNTQITFQFGLLVGSGYEYINYGTFIVNKSEKQENTNSYILTCYDKMLYSMIPYESLNVIYPITIRNYISAICTKLGLQFQNTSDNFVNYNKQIPNELYLDSDGNSLDYTFRDVLDELAQVTASTICINDNGKLEVRYITNTNDTIDEEFLKNVNVNFGEQYGAINTITFSRSADSDSISKSIPTNLPDADKIEIKISDNQILNGNNRDEFIDGILNKLYGLSYYINDFASTGITYYDLCDRYNVKVGNTTYSCVMLNDEININNGVVENIHTEMPKTSKTDYTKTDKTDRKLNQTYLIVDKQQGQINAVVSQVDEIEQDLSNPTNTLTGQYFDIDNALDEPLVDFSMEGQTEQDGTTGKNLLDTSLLPITNNGITISQNDNGDIVINGTPTYSNGFKTFTIGVTKTIEANTYTMSVVNKKVGLGITIGGFGGSLNLTMADVNTSKSNTSTRAYEIKAQINIMYNAGSFNNYIFNPMLEIGSSQTSYEPYTNGPSPNPDYPQDIHCVSGDNTIKICGKNILPLSASDLTLNRYIGNDGSEQTSISGNYYGSYTYIDFNFGGKTIALSDGLELAFYDSSKTFISYIGRNQSRVQNVPNNCSYIRIDCYKDNINEMQIEFNSSQTPYEAYTGNSQLISLGSIELCKIGTYQDYIYRQDNRWYLHKEIGKWNITELNDFGQITQYQNNLNATNGIISLRYNKRNFASKNIKEFANGYANWGFSNKLKSATSNLWNDTGQVYKFGMTDGLMLGVLYTDLGLDSWTNGAINDLQTRISTYLGDIYFLLPLATPTDTEITGTLLEQLNRLMTLPLYKSMTHITIEPNDLTPIMNIEYVRDTAINSQFVRQPQLNNYYTRTETTAQIQIGNASIKQDVAEIQTTLDNNGNAISSLSSQVQNLQTSTSQQINVINQTLENGVEKLTNSLVTIDINGINTSKDNETFNTQITNKTFEVKDGDNRMGFMGFDTDKQKMLVEFPEMQTQKLTNAYHTTEKITEDGLKWSADFYVGDDI